MKLILLMAIVLIAAVPARGQGSPLFRDWREPSGSVIRIGPCARGVCLWIVSLSPDTPATVDAHNPSQSLRNRLLCGLEIGHGFYLSSSTHASGGTLYDPKTGKTYRGMMSIEGENLRLRGYIMTPIFGRTEIWKPARQQTPSCAVVTKPR